MSTPFTSVINREHSRRWWSGDQYFLLYVMHQPKSLSLPSSFVSSMETLFRHESYLNLFLLNLTCDNLISERGIAKPCFVWDQPITWLTVNGMIPDFAYKVYICSHSVIWGPRSGLTDTQNKALLSPFPPSGLLMTYKPCGLLND